MSVYSPSVVKELRKSELVAPPEFEWNEFDKIPAQAQKPWTKRAIPKAALPFSQRALFATDAEKEALAEQNKQEKEEAEVDDDEFAARYLLKKDKSRNKHKTNDTDREPVINLSYAAALAASMKMSDPAETEAVAEVDEEGWTSVSQTKGRKNRNRSFDGWRA